MSKLRFTLLLGCLMCISALAFLFIPYPNSRSIIDIYGKLGILEDTYYAETEIFPMFSTHQAMDVYIYAYNGSFTLMVLDDDEFYNWAEDKPYSTLYTSSNLTYINEEIDVTVLDDWPYLRCSIVIKPETYLVVTGNLSIKYLEHYVIAGFTFLSFAFLALGYYFYKQNKLALKFRA